MMVKIFFTLATAALVLGAPAPQEDSDNNMMKLAADRPQNPEPLLLAPVSPSKYRLDDQIAEEQSKLKKRSVFQRLPDGRIKSPGFCPSFS